MTMTDILLFIGLLLLVVNILIAFLKKPASSNSDELKSELARANVDISKIDPLIRNEFSNNRVEIQKTSRDNRQELGESLKTFTEQFSTSTKDNRKELTESLKSFEEKFTGSIKDFNEFQRNKFNDLLIKQEQLKNDTEIKLDNIRETVEHKLTTLQLENSKKLEEMRVTVDEKLQSTLEKRFNDSFTLISERLELVHKGLGEMQTLAISVGDIKKVMTNVKSRGIMGEYQLANILEDLLTNEQYEKNVRTKAGSGEVVEFAIKLPNNNNLDKTLWLPIDSKFPKEDYEALVDAYDEADPVKLEILRKAFKNAIIKSAKDIRTKYIDPPNTTDIGIMFLPFESLYAEVLRTPGLFELLQKDFRITITGPTTLSALLNSLQMGFRTLEIQKRSSEVWDILSVVKKEFGKFGDVLEKTKRQLQAATKTIGDAGVRTRAIEKQLKNVQETPSLETATRMENEIQAESLDLENTIEDILFDNEAGD
ncbi:MAG: DNA recombination protein RmuC [Ferruginibacter sp.]